MKPEWKRGDLALIVESGSGDTVLAVNRRVSDVPCWHRLSDDRCYRASVVEDVRPLVVIDPEDAVAVRRLAEAYDDVLRRAFHGEYDSWSDVSEGDADALMRDALRSLVTPPKPNEPTGLGAVVEDAEGRRWTRPTLPAGANAQWVEAISAAVRHYAAIDAVRVLSEGVQP